MAKNLVIVESPAKAKTIEGFLGKDFQVKSSFGHIRDLPSKGISVDIDKNFQPQYEIPAEKKKLVSELKKLAKAAEVVWLATDEDREGEAISWHLQEALNLKDANTKRIVFHEITKDAILNAIKNPRTVNKKLVDAQQARRVLDRLVGYEVSPILWRKVKPSLSAGRVQSVAVRLLVEREREIKDFNQKASFKVTALFDVDGKAVLKAELPQHFDTEKAAQSFLESCINATFSIGDIEKKPGTRTPAAPFTTSTLQQEASRKLGYSVAQTMRVAQKLYEAGKITYMRTDSVNLSDLALAAAKKEITQLYGAEYAKTRKYQTKSKGAQEAHEAIRPTYINKTSVDGDNQEQRLYDLIWKRTVASQMEDAKLERTTVKIDISSAKEKFVAKGEVIKFDGFLKLYIESTDDEQEEESGLLPPLNIGQKLGAKNIAATERFANHPPRYTEASLVRKLEELGIGRPSTYAPTISTVQKRGYVVKEDREGVERKYKTLTLKSGKITSETKVEITGREKSKLFPTDIGSVVTDFLVENFGHIMDYGFTAEVEQEFDEVAEGLKQWDKMLKNFYQPFHKAVEDTLENATRATGERVLGKDPKTGKDVVARIGRFGPMVQIGSAEDEEKPRFASIPHGESIETITFEKALDLFQLPRKLGVFNGEEVETNIGRFGPYIRYGKKFVSLKAKEGDDPFSVTLDRAKILIQEKEEAEKNRVINVFKDKEGNDVEVLNGRFGPYVKIGKQNFKIPKGTDAKALTLEDCLKLEPSKSKRKK